MTYLYLFQAEKVKDSRFWGCFGFCFFSRLSKHPGAQYCPEWQESFVCEQETEPTKGADGTMGRAELRPIAEDEFCVLGNLLKVQNCLLSVILMTQGFEFKEQRSGPQGPGGNKMVLTCKRFQIE